MKPQAQAEWKKIWNTRASWESPRHWQKKVRYSAALERQLASKQRTIDALQMRVWQLEAQEHNTDDGNEWEKEYYLRGMNR